MSEVERTHQVEGLGAAGVHRLAQRMLKAAEQRRRLAHLVEPCARRFVEEVKAQHGLLAGSGEEFDGADLEGLETRRGVEAVAELEETLGRHRLEDPQV